MMMKDETFEWNDEKDAENRRKHGISFKQAQLAFLDERRIIRRDLSHSKHEERFFCFGAVDDGIMTVRFTMRNDRIRIFGAGYWRKGKKDYEENQTRKRR